MNWTKNPLSSRPPVPPLPETLAERVRFLREKRFLTAEGLANKALVPLQIIEDIESGIELFMAPAMRQRIARVLQVRPGQLQAVEKTTSAVQALSLPSETASRSLQQQSIHLREEILKDPEGTDYFCPACQAPLQTHIFERRDLQDRPLLVVKANCTQCLFRLVDD